MILVAAGTAHIEKEFREVEIFLFASNAVEFGQAHFHDLVSRPDMVEFVGLWAESIAKQIGLFESDIEEIGFAGGLVVSRGCFEDVPGIVEFMAVDGVHLPSFVAGPSMRILGIDR